MDFYYQIYKVEVALFYRLILHDIIDKNNKNKVKKMLFHLSCCQCHKYYSYLHKMESHESPLWVFLPNNHVYVMYGIIK